MTKPLLTSVSLDELLTAYVNASSAHGKATESGDHQIANKNYDAIVAVYGELRRRGLEAQRNLLVLLDNKDVGVRYWAAFHALEFAPEQGQSVLASLARTHGSLVGLSAKVTLEEWQKGTLQFP